MARSRQWRKLDRTLLANLGGRRSEPCLVDLKRAYTRFERGTRNPKPYRRPDDPATCPPLVRRAPSIIAFSCAASVRGRARTLLTVPVVDNQLSSTVNSSPSHTTTERWA